MKILGTRIDNLSKKEIFAKIENFLLEEKFHQVATVNPEFILCAQKDEIFKSILNRCDLNIADGIGLKYAFLWKAKWLKSRIAGADLVQEILHIANKRKLSVYLVVNKNGLCSFAEIKSVLAKKYPYIQLDGCELPKMTHEVLGIQAEILFCNFGSPEQEKFIDLQKNDTIRLAIGIGGTFDFLTGKIKRAPKIMRLIGLEWLFRMIQEPTYRLKRVFGAIFLFPLAVIFSKNDE